MERNKAVQWGNKYAFMHAPVNDSLVDHQFMRVQVPPPALVFPHNNAPAVPTERVVAAESNQIVSHTVPSDVVGRPA